MQGEIKMQKTKRTLWNENEDSYLTMHYAEEDKEKIMENIPNRSWDAIKLRAAKLGVKRSYKFRRDSKLAVLLDNSLESFYWIGFLLADAHFSSKKRIILKLSDKDEEHIARFADYISSKYSVSSRKLGDKEYPTVTITAQDIDVVPKLCNIFDISSNKTENPPNMGIYCFLPEQLFSLTIGFIDGDGSITKLHNRPDVNLRVKCHNTWIANLLIMEHTLYTITNNPVKEPPLTNINNQGYAQFCISNNKIIKAIKSKAIEYKLPIMNRKWDKITIN
jgi:hypothetical protein